VKKPKWENEDMMMKRGVGRIVAKKKAGKDDRQIAQKELARGVRPMRIRLVHVGRRARMLPGTEELCDALKDR